MGNAPRRAALWCGFMCVALFAARPAFALDCALDRVELRGDFGALSFQIEIADDASERAQGLMNRDSLARGAGMLFLYQTPQRVAFWMENTLIPLDMIFVDAAGVITRIHENAVPLDRTPIAGGDSVRAVLEINAGLSQRYGFAVGDELHHPAFGPTAAWPCT